MALRRAPADNPNPTATSIATTIGDAGAVAATAKGKAKKAKPKPKLTDAGDSLDDMSIDANPGTFRASWTSEARIRLLETIEQNDKWKKALFPPANVNLSMKDGGLRKKDAHNKVAIAFYSTSSDLN